ncbi:MAG: sulfite exporter TauE/SafE family protein [Myxococcota bacterium]
MEWFAFAMAAAFASQFIKGVTGFGSALVLTPLLSLIWPPEEAILLVTLSDLLGGTLLLPGVWQRIEPRLVGRMAPALLVGQFIGTALLVSLPVDTVRLVIGALVGLFGASMVARPSRPGRGEWTALPAAPGPVLGWSAVSALAGGAMGGLTGASGPPIIAFAQHYFEPQYYRAQLIGLFWIGACTLTAILLWRGVGNAEMPIRMAAMLPGLVVGSVLGGRLSGRIPNDVFNRCVGLLLVLVAFGLMR